MIITTSGNIGIGDVSPSQMLDIDGTNPQILIEESTTEFVRIGVEASTGDMVIGWDDSDDVHFGVFTSPTDTTVTSHMTISSAGATNVVNGLTAGTITSYGDATLSSKLITSVSSVNIPDDTIPSNAPTLTYEPTTSYATIDCDDPDGCKISMKETGAVDGQIITLVVISNPVDNACTLQDVAAEAELNGNTNYIMNRFDTVQLIYSVDRWMEIGRSNN